MQSPIIPSTISQSWTEIAPTAEQSSELDRGNPISFQYDTPFVRGTAWEKLDSQHWIERTLQILCRRVGDKFRAGSKEFNASLFFNCLEFLSSCQKIANDQLISIDISEFKIGLSNLINLLKQSDVILDECLPEFLTHSDQFIQELEQKGKSQINKDDLFLMNEATFSILTVDAESIYGSEFMLTFRMWERFKGFLHSCYMGVFLAQLMGASKCAKNITDYNSNAYQSIIATLETTEISIATHKNIINFYRQKCEEIDEKCNSWNALMKRTVDRTMTKYLKLFFQDSPSNLVMHQDTLSDYKIMIDPQFIDRQRIRLSRGASLKNAIQRLNVWNENQFHQLKTKWKESYALLLFVIKNFENTSSVGSLEKQFDTFLQDFDQQEKVLKSNLSSLLKTKPTLLMPYINSEKMRQTGLKALSNQLEQSDLFSNSCDYMESTLKLYHEAHKHFWDIREKTEVERQLASELKRRALSISTTTNTSSTNTSSVNCLPPSSSYQSLEEIQNLESSSSSEPPKQSLENCLHQAVNQSVNRYARNALYNAISLLEDLFSELDLNVIINSNRERIEHLDLILINLSLTIEQMLSFKVLKTINPKDRLEAYDYLRHNLFQLCQSLPESLSEEAKPLAQSLNGAENYSRTLQGPISSEAVNLLQKIHSLPKDGDNDLEQAQELQKTVYRFVKEQLENSLKILFDQNILTEEWQTKWQQREMAITFPQIFEEDSPKETNELIKRIDAIVLQCESQSNAAPFSVWIRNAERLFKQLKSRVIIARKVSDLSATEKRTAGLICLASWSLCIASAAEKGRINLQTTPTSALSKNLWDWIDPVLGKDKVDNLSSGEEYFCDLSGSNYRHIRYQHSVGKKANQHLWRIGYDPKEEALSAFKTASSKPKSQKMVTLNDGLGFVERILNTLPKPQLATSSKAPPRRGRRRYKKP